MNPLHRFRQWLAEPLLARLREEYYQQAVDLQREAYRLGHHAGYDQGQAAGELRGQQMLLNEFGRYLGERRDDSCTVTPQDVERAKKGILH